jgi:hypothetical protein
MNRKLIFALVVLLVAAGSAGVIWVVREKPVVAGPALPSFDYAAAESWAVRPQTPPAAVWESGWAFDVLILASGAALETGDADRARRSRNKAEEEARELASAFDAIGKVYVPFLRASDPGPDLAAALAAYIANDNRGRALVIATDLPLPAEAATLFAEDALLRDRFAGVLTYADDAGFAPGTDATTVCSRRYDAGEGCTLPADLKRADGGRLTAGFLAWLNDYSSKLAEPLGDLEEIDIIEIQTAPERQ